MARTKQSKQKQRSGRGGGSSGKSMKSHQMGRWQEDHARGREFEVGDAVKFRGLKISGVIVSIDDDGYTYSPPFGVKVVRGKKTCVRYVFADELAAKKEPLAITNG